MGEIIIGGFDEGGVSPWVLQAYNDGQLSPLQMAEVDYATGQARNGGEAELLRQQASPLVVEMLARVGGIAGLRERTDALMAEGDDF